MASQPEILELNQSTKQMLSMSKSALIKECKKYKIAAIGTKKEMIRQIIKAQKNKKNREISSSKRKKKLTTKSNANNDEKMDENHMHQKTKANAKKNNFIVYMSLDELKQLQINDKIDHRNSFGKFVAATITHKENTKLTIHYDN
eukprot:314149_1